MPLARILEPEVMADWQDASDYDAMDHTAVNRQFVGDLLAAGDPGDAILDLGTGTARIPIELCQHRADGRVMAADLSIPMLELARYNIEIAGLIERIQLDHVDVKQLPYPDACFTAVMSNGMLHHLAEPGQMLAEALRVTAPGGMLFIRDLLRPDSEAALDALVQTCADQETAQQQGLFAASLRAALTLDEIRAAVASLGGDPGTAQITSDRHWTWSARK